MSCFVIQTNNAIKIIARICDDINIFRRLCVNCVIINIFTFKSNESVAGIEHKLF